MVDPGEIDAKRTSEELKREAFTLKQEGDFQGALMKLHLAKAIEEEERAREVALRAPKLHLQPCHAAVARAVPVPSDVHLRSHGIIPEASPPKTATQPYTTMPVVEETQALLEGVGIVDADRTPPTQATQTITDIKKEALRLQTAGDIDGAIACLEMARRLEAEHTKPTGQFSTTVNSLKQEALALKKKGDIFAAKSKLRAAMALAGKVSK